MCVVERSFPTLGISIFYFVQLFAFLLGFRMNYNEPTIDHGSAICPWRNLMDGRTNGWICDEWYGKLKCGGWTFAGIEKERDPWKSNRLLGLSIWFDWMRFSIAYQSLPLWVGGCIYVGAICRWVSEWVGLCVCLSAYIYDMLYLTKQRPILPTYLTPSLGLNDSEIRLNQWLWVGSVVRWTEWNGMGRTPKPK